MAETQILIMGSGRPWIHVGDRTDVPARFACVEITLDPPNAPVAFYKRPRKPRWRPVTIGEPPPRRNDDIIRGEITTEAERQVDLPANERDWTDTETLVEELREP